MDLIASNRVHTSISKKPEATCNFPRGPSGSTHVAQKYLGICFCIVFYIVKQSQLLSKITVNYNVQSLHNFFLYRVPSHLANKYMYVLDNIWAELSYYTIQVRQHHLSNQADQPHGR